MDSIILGRKHEGEVGRGAGVTRLTLCECMCVRSRSGACASYMWQSGEAVRFSRVNAESKAVLYTALRES